MNKIIMIGTVSLLLAFAGCGGSGGSSGGGTFEDAGAAWTADKSAVVIGGKDENVMVLTANAISFRASDGSPIVLYYANGLPTKAVVGTSVILFENWTANSVDVAFVAADGSIKVERGLAIDEGIIARLQAINASISAGDAAKLFDFLSDVTLGEAWEFAGTAFSAALCGASIGAAAASGGIATPGVALACASTAVYFATELDLISEDNATVEGSGLILTGLDVLDCAGGDPTACAGVGFELGNAILDVAGETEAPIADEVALADKALEFGGGSVQVTLQWDRTVDLDLHVVDPDSEEIYFGHRTSASGGQLDVDDLDGGEENIFWPEDGAPDGTYTWWVRYFSGSGATDYRVLVTSGDTSTVYNGTLSSSGEETAHTTFTFPAE